MGVNRAFLALALVVGLSACASSGPPVEVYRGASEKYPDERAAEEAWQRIFNDQPVFIDGMTLSGGYFGKGRFFVKSIGFQLRTNGSPDDYFAIERQDGAETVRVRLQDLPNPIRVLQIQPPINMTKYIVVISDDLAIVPDRAFQSRNNNPTYSRQTAQNMADILSTMREFAIEPSISDYRWQQVVHEYSWNRPPITEEMRRYAVEAESFIKQKRFSDASRSYGEALRRWPWWSQARYMRALVLGELKRYTYAAKEMTRYLELEPNAPDYRRLKDQVYEWESYARR